MISSRVATWLGLGLALVWLVGARPSLACESDEPSEEPTQEQPSESVTPASSVRLSELLPAPSAGEEFIELEVLDTGGGYLHGWSVQDAGGKVFTFDQAEMETYADQFFVLSDGVSKIALNNTGDRVDLINPSGEIVGSAEFGEAETDLSWSWFESGWAWGEMSPGVENVVFEDDVDEGEEGDEEESDGDSDTPEEDTDEAEEEEPVDTGLDPVSTLYLNELLPNPEGDESTDEWFELVNEGSAGTLEGWSVTDGKSTYVFPDQAVEEGEMVVVVIQESGINLNNTGDVVYLVGPSGEIVQGVEYGDAPSEQSFSRFGEAWEWTNELTPGETNIGGEESAGENADAEAEEGEAEDDESEQRETLSLAEVRGLEKGTTVNVSGVVGVEPGPLGSQIMYIQDEAGGMQIYSYQKDFPADLMRGSLVSVAGVTSTAYEEVRVNADEGGMLVLEQQDEVLPQAVDALVAEDIGMIVVTKGMVESKSTTRLQLDSGIEVYVKSSTDISLSGIAAGDNIQVVGVVSQYNDTLRLMPREQADVVVEAAEQAQAVSVASAAGPVGTSQAQTSATPSKSSTSGLVVLSLAGAVILLGSIRSWWKKKRVAKRMFQPYTGGHESQRSAHSGRSISVQLPPGTRS